MNRETKDRLIDASIQLGLTLANRVLIPWLASLVDRDVDVPTAHGAAVEIVAGIDRDWPDLSGDEKRLMAHDAIAVLLRNRNGREASARDVNLMLELALAEATQPAPETAPNR